MDLIVIDEGDTKYLWCPVCGTICITPDGADTYETEWRQPKEIGAI